MPVRLGSAQVRTRRRTRGLLACACLVSLWVGACTPELRIEGRDGSPPCARVSCATDAGAPPGEEDSTLDACGNGVDDDRDTRVDEGCRCQDGSSQPCWSGPVTSRGVGACNDGVQQCVRTDSGASWGECVGQTLPLSDVAGDGEDLDCDGTDGPCAEANECVPSCLDTPWGDVPDGFASVAFDTRFPEVGAPPCSARAEARVCARGVMSGSNTELLCSNYACTIADAQVQRGMWYRTEPSPGASWRGCEPDGTFGPLLPAPSPEPNADVCAWSDVYFPRGACGFYEGETFVCDPPNWIVSTAACPPAP